VPTKKTPEKKPAPTRRSPIARSEGERRLIEAANTLIRSKPFSEVSLREISLLANVNHRFVHTWFGGKNELLLAVVRQKVLALVDAVPLASSGSPAINFFDPDVVSMVRLVIWLDLEGVNTGELFANTPLVDALTARYVEVENIDPAIARQAATQAISLGLAGGTFGSLLGLSEMSSVVPVMQLWRHIVGLLAEHPPK
jgi:AcrR family transcriptional regulator